MSHTYYAKLWLDAQKDLEKLLELDKLVQEGQPIENKPDAAKIVSELYFRYRRMVHRLTVCHDSIVQPQIREAIGKMLDYSIIRMLEYRQENVNLTSTECPWPNDVLINMKLTPEEVDLHAPLYNAYTKMMNLEHRRKVVEDSIANSLKEQESASEISTLQSDSIDSGSSQATLTSRRRRAKSEATTPSVIIKETPEQKIAREAKEAEIKKVKGAIVLIQSHERARVARRIAKKAARALALEQKMATGELKTVSEKEQARAAIVIQKTWRGVAARCKVKNKINQIEEVLGMTISCQILRNTSKLTKDGDETVNIQSMAVQHLQGTVEKEKGMIWKTHGPRLVEDIRDEIREWFLLWFNELGYFDSIPEAKFGGSALVATGQSRTPQEYLQESAEANTPKKPGADADGPKEPDFVDLDEEERWTMPESKIYPILVEVNKEFRENWSIRIEEILDPKGGLIHSLIKDKLYQQLQLEMREVADESMRLELNQLNEALMLDHANDEVRFVPPSPQKFEVNADNDTLLNERKDPLAEVSEDELLIELTRSQVIRDYPECHLRDWPGVVSYAIIGHYPETRLGDLTQPVMDYCVLPMGSKIVHELAPPVRSVCICGPPGAGQLFIAQAICSELKATVFDLTPEKHVGRYMGKETQNRLVQAVLKLARAYAPSVILVEGEKAWWKKIPPELSRVKPKRFAPIYKKIVNGIKPGDQVLFLTTSTQPYMASRPFVKIHDKFIIIPVADYATLYSACKNSLMSHAAIDRQFNVSCLAKIMANRTTIECAQDATTRAARMERRMIMRRKPLTQGELLEELMASKPTKKDLEGFSKFQAKLPLEAKRKSLMLKEQEELQESAKKKKK